MTIDTSLDAYAALQVDPSAHEVVIRAAYHALARRYHPDGVTPDPQRMAELNHAYDLIRDEVRRRVYDQRRRELVTGDAPMQPVGPGATRTTRVASPTDSTAGGAEPPGTSPYAGPFSRARAGAGAEQSARLDFGRYTGWSLRDVARHDPDYLRWLSRHSAGVRYRGEILRLLPVGAATAGAPWREPVR